MAVLVTGGTGYIGSHTAIQLINSGEEVVLLDNLSNSSLKVLDRLEQITGKKVKFYQKDLRNLDEIQEVFQENEIGSVIHFAALKAVGESVAMPLEYYSNNLTGTLNLLQVMKAHDVKNFVFSSSATVYGNPASNPITEDFPLSTTNPYGATKLMIEDVLRDMCKADSSWNVAILRYFNPVGAHISGLIGEEPNGIPNNLMPYITKVAVGQLEALSVFGDDYDTADGTGVRDYIHVEDLADGHLKALAKLQENPGLVTYNLGTGNGYSVLELVRAFAKASQKEIPYKIAPRRPGDIAACYANPAKAEIELGWKAKFDVNAMCEDSWRWQEGNPDGYR